jgi:glycerate kinase
MLDDTSLVGKVIGEVIRRAARLGVAVTAIVGCVAPGVAATLPGDVSLVELVAFAEAVEHSLGTAFEFARTAAQTAVETALADAGR